MTDTPSDGDRFPEVPGLEMRRILGSGGFAVVYEAYQPQQDRLVAVKVLKEVGLTAERLHRFEQESRIMGRLSEHPSIVDIFSTGVTTDGRPFIVMKHYSGGHYGNRAAGGAMRQEDVLRVGVLMCSAVEAAHRFGLVHRDIKPENILIDKFGLPGLTDFGIASEEQAREDDGAMTIAYAAPELMRGTAVPSKSSDIYSLAATLWALLSGAPPYPGPMDESAIDMMRRILASPVPRMPRQGVHPRLEQLLREGLDHDPSARPSSALDFAGALQRVEKDLNIVPTDVLIVEEVPSAFDGGSGSWTPGDTADPARPDHTGDLPKPPVRPATRLTKVQPRQQSEAVPSETAAPAAAAAAGPARRIMIGAAVAVLVAAAAAVGLTAGGDSETKSTLTVEVTVTADLGEPIRIPRLLDGAVATMVDATTAEIVFSLDSPQTGDQVQVSLVGGDGSETVLADESPVRVDLSAPAVTPCFLLTPRSLTRISTEVTQVCVTS